MTNKSKTPDTCAFANQSFEHRDDELEKLYDFTEKLELERNKYRQALRRLSKLGLGACGGGGGLDDYSQARSKVESEVRAIVTLALKQ